jgi:hypothetical protein
MESWQQMFLPARGGPKFLVQNLTSTPLCQCSWLVKMSSPILGLYSVDHKEDRVYPLKMVVPYRQHLVLNIKALFLNALLMSL